MIKITITTAAAAAAIVIIIKSDTLWRRIH